MVAIVDTSSDYTTCHRDMPALVEAVRRGVLQGGALPLTLPTLSLGEILITPTSMLYRNLLAMETEEALTAYPMDAAVLVGGCDKTVPAQLMAAASADVPAVALVTGPMRTGSWRGTRLGACTDCRAHWQQFRAGALEQAELEQVQQELCPTGGTCMVMGTASTMACLSEALGLMLPGGAAAASGSGARLRHAVATGRRAAALAQAPLRPSQVLTPAAFANAVTALLAIGGSTNAVIHLLAIARRGRRRAHPRRLRDGRATGSPAGQLQAQRQPVAGGPAPGWWDAGSAGRVAPAAAARRPLCQRPDPGRANRRPSPRLLPGREAPRGLQHPWRDRHACPNLVIGTLEAPIGGLGALAVLRGSLAPDGAILKRSAAAPALLRHRGPALVFDSPADLTARIDDPDLPVTPDHVLVLRNSGPAAAGMPETGSLPIPRKLAVAGIRDMVRVSDARMSGTAGGTVVLHCSPEAARGGPLALVEDGDPIELDADRGRIDLLVARAELEARRTRLPAQPPLARARLAAAARRARAAGPPRRRSRLPRPGPVGGTGLGGYSMILLSGYSTIPLAPACFRRGMRSRTTASSITVFTAIQSPFTKPDRVGFRSAGSTATTPSTLSWGTFIISPTLPSAAMAPRSISATFSDLAALPRILPGGFVGDQPRGALHDRVDDTQVVGPQRAAGLGDLHDGVGKPRRLDLGGPPRRTPRAPPRRAASGSRW